MLVHHWCDPRCQWATLSIVTIRIWECSSHRHFITRAEGNSIFYHFIQCGEREFQFVCFVRLEKKTINYYSEVVETQAHFVVILALCSWTLWPKVQVGCVTSISCSAAASVWQNCSKIIACQMVKVMVFERRIHDSCPYSLVTGSAGQTTVTD